ncbi:homeobox-domain-containing protein, partial [Basidiobolus meristosporus CBS 931.73]
KKRTRATPEQLAILEDAFMTNTSPNSKVREALAERIKMSERSIQIWFQNRRAKVKLMQKRTHLLQQEAISRQSMSAPTTPNAPLTDGIHLFSCDTLGVGTWRRMAITKNDLLCYFNLSEKKMSWQITDNSSRFKMEFPFSAAASIEYKAMDAIFGQIIIDINQVPEFSMEVKVGGNPIWTACRDFTEGKQASRFFRHVIRGHAQPL